MISYSHSKLEVIRKCLLLYKNKYIDKLEGEQDKSATDFGEVSHSIAENYKGTGKQELLDLYKGLVKEKYKLTDFYVKKIPLSLKNIHTFHKTIIEDESVEWVKRELDLKAKLTDDIEINGKIDILIKYKNGRYKIGDYKTSKSSKYGDHTNQLAMYKLLLNKNYDIPYSSMDSDIIYIALDGEDKYGNIILNEGLENIIKPYDVTASDIYCLEEEIKSIHNMILKNMDTNIWKENPTWFNCTYCQYSKICTKKFIN